MKRKWKIWKAYVAGLGFFPFLDYCRQRFIIREELFNIRVKGLQQPVYLRNQPSDHAIFTQLFIQKEYGERVTHPVKHIIDCGANIGLAALYFLQQYPDAQITCIEPDEDNFRLLKMNTATYSNIVCLQKAVWHEVVPLDIFGRSRGAAGLMVKEADNGETQFIEGLVLSSLISAQQPVDILKMDIEGSEKQVLLEGGIGWLDFVQTLFVELHDDIHPGITDAITRKFESCFSIRKMGEYHVFERK